MAIQTRHYPTQEQDNTWTGKWSDFWADRRIGDLIRRSGDRELATLEIEMREKVYPLLFNQEAMKNVRPAIIHGDLWSGNAGTDEESGQPIIFDPSSSYSHNEAELGIMKMFGGYGKEFFEAYHGVIPKAQPYYNERQDMYEAYHHLNHFVMFGGSYRSGTVRIFKRLIAWAEKEGKKRDQDGGGGGGGGGGGNGGDDGSGAGVGPRGLRGGANEPSQRSSTSHYSEPGPSFTSSKDQPPTPPGAARLSTSNEQGSSFRQSPPPTSSFPPATPSQIADYFSQMICYLWFSSGVPGHSMPTTPSRSPTSVHLPLQSSPLAPRRIAASPYHIPRQFRPSHAKTASAGNLSQALSTSLNSNDLSKAIEDHLISPSTRTKTPPATNSRMMANDPMLRRLQPKSRFLRFSREVLSTTQVSTSVITLALVYVHRLKAAHPHLKGRDGSEFRLAISSLMLANKILDDNTYLNKTWAEISGMPLVEISKMEVEFWLGLKMELHITKEEYEVGLGELQMLANDRNRAVLQRDAAMKRAIQQQALAQVPQWNPYMQPQFSVSSDGLVGQSDQSLRDRSTSYVVPLVSHSTVRRSVGNTEAMSNPMYTGLLSPSLSSVQPFSVPITSAFDFIPTTSNYNMQTPPYFSRSTTFTLPPSPLSQASAGLNVTPNDGVSSSQPSHYSLGDASASSFSSRDRINSSASQSLSGDSIWSMLHHGGNGGASAMEQSMSASTFPNISSNSQTTETSPSSSLRGFAPPDYAASHGRPSLSNHSSTLSGLKRDFEKTNLDGLSSPLESHLGSKRFAAESSSISDDLKHYQLSASSSRRPSQSPTETRYALRSRSRAAVANRRTGQRSASRDPFRTSASPNHLSTLSRQVSPAMQRMGSTSSNSHLPRAVSAQEVHSHQPHPNYHSVFTSALTPNALTAPLENPAGTIPPHHAWHGLQSGGRKVGPLQYYSLAAGEPFGNIGTYLPPPNNRGWNANAASLRRTSMQGESRSASQDQNLKPEHGEQSTGSWTGHYGVGPHTPVSAPSFGNPNGSTKAYEHGSNSKDDLMSTTTNSAPFSMDVHAWPLTNSTSSNFLFPYHLLPHQPQSQPKQQQYHHHYHHHHHHEHQQHSHLIP